MTESPAGRRPARRRGGRCCARSTATERFRLRDPGRLLPGGPGIGAVARLSVKTDVDFFLSGRRLPAWITGLAFIAANLGALEILGQAANSAQYGVAAVHYYWIGAVPAMVFLGA